uniref:Phorbol-12-myristate-13-acetate-induced protein 1 n=1 Tax=Pseudonaja textilis TaxID=8673 RepID=A0A670ZS96_PSETE
RGGKERQRTAASTEECSVMIALQLRRIGDKWNLRQRILNLFSKLFCPGT